MGLKQGMGSKFYLVSLGQAEDSVLLFCFLPIRLNSKLCFGQDLILLCLWNWFVHAVVGEEQEKVQHSYFQECYGHHLCLMFEFFPWIVIRNYLTLRLLQNQIISILIINWSIFFWLTPIKKCMVLYFLMLRFRIHLKITNKSKIILLIKKWFNGEQINSVLINNKY